MMIVLTRLNDRQFAINPDLIERIHASPDTTLVMVDGAKYIVTESLSEVIDCIANYRARVISLAHSGASADRSSNHRALELVPTRDDEDDTPEADAETVALHPRTI